MNHQCRGDYFIVEGLHYYRCNANSVLIQTAVNLDCCPNCGRPVLAEDHGVVPLVTYTECLASLPDGRRIMLSSSES